MNYLQKSWLIAKAGGQATPAFLRYIKQVEASKGAIKFDIKTLNEASVNPFEHKLSQGAAFVVTHIGVHFVLAASQAAQLTAEKHTFPNENVFSTNYEVLYALYNGQLNYTVGQNEVLQGFEMDRFLFKPITQKLVGQVATAAAGDSTSPVADAGNSFAGFVCPDPAIFILDSMNEMKLAIEFEAQASVPANTYLSLTFRGYKVTNGGNMTKGARWQNIMNQINSI